MKPRLAARFLSGERVMRIEPLEERCVLDAAVAADGPGTDLFPWHNSQYRLDVNNDGVTSPRDLLAVINQINAQGFRELPVPAPEPVTIFCDTNGDNLLTPTDLLRIINGLLKPPAVEVSMLAPFTIDVTPQVTVNADVSNGSPVELDVDLNNDGDFSDPGELSYTQSTVYNGQSTFDLTPALPRSPDQYSVRLRARVANSDAVPGASAAVPIMVDTRTSTALADYVNTDDGSYACTLRSTQDETIAGIGAYTYYSIDMTSQTWRSASEVDQPVWRHWLNIYVPQLPAAAISHTATLLIDGGNNHSFDTPPDPSEPLAVIALSLGSIVVDLTDIPSEPLTFTGETSSRSEDEIIAYSFDKFLNNVGEPGNDTWPLLVAMTKSAVKAMDTVQAFVPDAADVTVDDFLVTGYSKRGWTTWLTAAVDDRVRAIIPGVFDNLNQGPQMVHQYNVYGFFSEAVQAYNDEHIFDRIVTPQGAELSLIEDPYRYLNNGRFDDMPKLLINSAGDEFFASDSAQFYIHDIPGETYLLYLPNVGHGLDGDLGADSQVVKSTITFTDAILNGRPLPEYSWTVAQDGSIHVQTGTEPMEVRLWQATNPDSRDFRHILTPSVVWTSEVLQPAAPGQYVGDVPMPSAGATAYFVQLIFPNNTVSLNPYLTNPYVFTTEIRVKSTLDLYAWPFDNSGVIPDSAPSATPTAAPLRDEVTSGTLAAAAFAIALETEDFTPPKDTAVETISLAAAAPVAPRATADTGAPLVEHTVADLWHDVDAADDQFADDAVETALSELLA